MQPVDPQIPLDQLHPDYKAAMIVNGPNHEYLDLPTVLSLHPSGQYYQIISRWTFTDEERQRIAAGEDVYVTICTTHRINPFFLTTGSINWSL